LNSKKLYFIVNQGAFFVSHRLDLAIKAKELGWQVKLLIGQSGSDEMELPAVEKLKEHGIEFQRLSYSPTGMNPFNEIWGVICLIYILIKDKPDVVHTVSPKGMLYGGLSSRIARVKSLVLAVSGMGYLYTNDAVGIKKIILKFVNSLTQFIVNHPNKKIIVQNKDDYSFFSKVMSVESNDIVLIPGSGVDLSKFKNIITQDNHSVILPARLLIDKGVNEFVQAAKILIDKGIKWRFILVGSANYDNPTSIGSMQVKQWVDEGIIEWFGHTVDMLPVYNACDVVCLPSYREGMPKVLLEAAAAGKPVVTTDVIGCREAIIPNVTGLLVPVKNPIALALALEKLIVNKNLRTELGFNGRKLANEKFSIKSVVESTFNTYSILDGKNTNE
jgi:glycosyltransferase involved in cell wall biosynthesis